MALASWSLSESLVPRAEVKHTFNAGRLRVTALLASADGQLAGSRAARAQLLQVIGLLRRRARWLVRADALVATALGVTIALIAFPLLTRAVTHLPGVPMAWTSGQARMTIAGVVAAYVLPAVVISVAGVRRRRRSPEESAIARLWPVASSWAPISSHWRCHRS